jgi:hypothetical protein
MIFSKKIIFMTMFFIGVLLIFTVCQGNADENLRLSGIIKSINHESKTVIVDVKSSSCRGIKSFISDNSSELDDFVNQKVVFFIDSTYCKKNEEYKILPGVEVRK